MLRRSPGLTFVAVLSLALGIGANVSIFTVVNAVFIHALPVTDPAGLYVVYTQDARNPGYLLQSYPNFKDYRDMNQVFSGMTLFCTLGLSLTGSGDPQPLVTEMVAANYFDVLGVRPIVGRTFQPEEDKVAGTAPVAVISYNLWQRKFAGDREVLGKPVHINGRRFTVIGVAPEGFQGPNLLLAAEVWIPMSNYPQLHPLARLVNGRHNLMFTAIGRLKPGMSAEQAQAGMRTVAAQLATSYPQDDEGRTVALMPLAEGSVNPTQRGDFVRVAQLMTAVVGLVLLIACINVANLLMARAGARRKEIAVRLSLGASRGRVIQQLLTESVLLSVLGGAAGILLAMALRPALWSIRPPLLKFGALDLSFDTHVLLFTLGISLLTGLVFGLAPALQISRTDLVTELKERTSQYVGQPQAASLRNLLVVGQVALSLVALIGAGLFLRSLEKKQQVDPGFETHHLLVLTYDLGSAGYNEQRAREFHQRVVERVLRVPSVVSASLATNEPFKASPARAVIIEGHEDANHGKGNVIAVDNVGSDYFHSVGIPILKGRGFTDYDNETAPRVAVVNQTFAKYFWPGQDAMGKRFHFTRDATAEWQIVGVARDAVYLDVGEKTRPMIYVPLKQMHDSIVTLHVRTAGDPALVVQAVRQAVQPLDPNLLLRLVRTMPQVIDQTLWAPRTGATLLSGFGLIALVLSVVGIYGVISFSVNQRVRDIGVRMALGATPMQILKEVLTNGCLLVGSGIAAGIGCALLVTRLLKDFLFDISATDPVTFLAVTLLLGVVALAACCLPALKATRVHPATALRHE